MHSNFVKMMVVLIGFSFVFINSCELPEDSEEFLVYTEDGIPLEGVDMDLIGLFYYGQFEPLNSVEIRGAIKKGKMNFDFSRTIELTSDYETYTEGGVRIGSLSIVSKNYRNLHFGLRKINFDDKYNEVDILYSSAEYIPGNSGHYSYYNGITIKAGWNFIEILENPNWFYESGENPYIIGLTTQNIKDIFEKGYRWQMGNWI
jgi:hypothetical protein